MLVRFEELSLSVSNTSGKFYNNKPWTFEIDAHCYTIPPGYQSDLASIPSLVRPFIKTWGKWTRAAFMHDWCIDYAPFSREYADKAFYYGLLSDGVKPWLAKLMFHAVKGNTEAKKRNRGRRIE